MKNSTPQIITFYNRINSHLAYKEPAHNFIDHYEMLISDEENEHRKAVLIFDTKEIASDFYKNLIEKLSSRHPGEKSSGSFASDNFSTSFTTSFGFPDEWHTGKLPHRNRINLVQFLTFRMADSLPQKVLRKIEEELRNSTDEEKEILKRKRYQNYLDNGYGCCALAHPVMAQVMQDALHHHDGVRYDLLAWSIMPNHAHVLIKANSDLSKILQSWKSFTGRWALKNNQKYGLNIPADSEEFWMSESWDRFIRDESHFNNTVNYILNNPVKARLPKGSMAYRFTGSVLSKRMKLELHQDNLKLELQVAQVEENDIDLMENLIVQKEYLKKIIEQLNDENSNLKVIIIHGVTDFDTLELQVPVFVFRYESDKN